MLLWGAGRDRVPEAFEGGDVGARRLCTVNDHRSQIWQIGNSGQRTARKKIVNCNCVEGLE